LGSGTSNKILWSVLKNKEIPRSANCHIWSKFADLWICGIYLRTAHLCYFECPPQFGEKATMKLLPLK
jgi:hypothetical protein